MPCILITSSFAQVLAASLNEISRLAKDGGTSEDAGRVLSLLRGQVSKHASVANCGTCRALLDASEEFENIQAAVEHGRLAKAKKEAVYSAAFLSLLSTIAIAAESHALQESIGADSLKDIERAGSPAPRINTKDERGGLPN